MLGGVSVPPSLNDALRHFGDAPEQRPEPFLAEKVTADPGAVPDKPDDVLIQAGAHRWPPLVGMEQMVQRMAELQGEKAPEDEEQRNELLTKAAKDDENVRKGLSGPIVHALEDAAAMVWLEGNEEVAKSLRAMARALAEADAPEQLPWAARILAFQVASLMRYMVPQGGGHDHDHDHAHDHDHEHDHDHDHDHA